MGDDDKPFACPQPGCGMRFVNEDHLSVHKLKHEMSLTLTPGARVAGNLFVDFSTDQTPTPTKFLRTCEEIGLFSELNPSKNPFEDAFKKAAHDNLSHIPTDVHTETLVSIDGGTLNTPIPQADSSQAQPEYIPLPGPTSDSGSTLGSSEVSPLNLKQDTEMAIDLRMSSASATVPSAPAPASTPSRAQPQRIKVTHDETLSPVDVEHTPPPESEDDLSIISSSSMPAPTSAEEEMSSTGEKFIMARTHQVLVTSQDMVTSPSITPQMVTSPMSAQGGIAIAAPVTAALRPQYVMQVMLQLPGGQTVPVQIPAAIGPGPSPGPSTLPSPQTPTPAPATVQMVSHQVVPQLQVKTEPQPHPAPPPVPQVVTTTPMPAQLPVTTRPTAVTMPVVTGTEVTTTSSAQSTASAITKQKLKAAITQNVQQSVLQNNMRVMTEAVERVIAAPAQRPQTLLKTTPGGGVLIHSQPPSLISSPTTVQTQAADTSTPYANKRSRKSTDEDPDERRRKFLERNRAAAARCRFKRKQWITNLERKADDINGVSLKLQTEINQLRAEVAQLKSLLLAHKDCPIFVQQRNSGQINLETVGMSECESPDLEC